MVKIRLFRTGAKHKISYRIVAVDSHQKRYGQPLEILGLYDPKTQPPTIKIKIDRLKYWLKQGAQTSLTVAKLVKHVKNN